MKTFWIFISGLLLGILIVNVGKYAMYEFESYSPIKSPRYCEVLHKGKKYHLNGDSASMLYHKVSILYLRSKEIEKYTRHSDRNPPPDISLCFYHDSSSDRDKPLLRVGLLIYRIVYLININFDDLRSIDKETIIDFTNELELETKNQQ